MVYKQLHTLNTIYVQTPLDGCQPPHDVCERHEIAAPAKIRKIIETSREDDWTTNAAGTSTKYVEWEEEFANGARTIGFYVVTKHPDMFKCGFDLGKEWLQKYGDKHFLVSCPIMEFEGATYFQRMNPMHVSLHIDNINLNKLMMSRSAFTICTGVTMVIAMCRLGFIDVDSTISLLVEYYRTHTLFASLEGYFLRQYTSNTSLQIADYPYLYAAMKGGDIRLLDVLLNIFKIKWNEHIPEHIITSSSMIYTNVITARAPYMEACELNFLDIRSFWNIDDATHDLGGFLASILTQDSMFKWWVRVGKKNIVAMVDAFQGEYDCLNQVMKRLFFYHSTGRFCKQRIQTVWKHFAEKLGHSIVIDWFKKYLKRLRTASPWEWMPNPPHEFIRDMYHICTQGTCIRKIHRLLAQFDHNSHLGVFKEQQDQKMTHRLCVLQQMCTNIDAWDPIRQFLERHQEYLFL